MKAAGIKLSQLADALSSVTSNFDLENLRFNGSKVAAAVMILPRSKSWTVDEVKKVNLTFEKGKTARLGELGGSLVLRHGRMPGLHLTQPLRRSGLCEHTFGCFF